MTGRGRQINTKHVITLGSVILTAWLLINGIYHTDGFLMSFANTGSLHTGLRIAVLVALITILVSRPPRSMPVRMALGMVSSSVLVGACVSMMDFYIGILDALLYLQVSIILAMEAIENHTVHVRFPPARSAH